MQAVFMGQGVRPMRLVLEDTFQGAHLSPDAFRALLNSAEAGLPFLAILPALACGRLP